jgi:DNA polymerase-3 subunit epsilon
VKFCVVDIETTGGGPRGDRITEIALVSVDDGDVSDRWSTLVNPGQPVTPFVVQLTGIDDHMLRNARDFASVWPDIASRLQGRIFVAHNVSFDYGVLQRECTDIGVSFQYPRLCTVRLSRKLFPGLAGGHSLGNLVKVFDLCNDKPHRALGDATATASLLRYLSKQRGFSEQVEFTLGGMVPRRLLPASVTPEQILSIPERPGVFRFLDEHNQRLFVGSGASLNRAVCQWFGASAKGKKLSLRERIRILDWEEYDWELIARLEAEQEASRFQPPGNTQRRVSGSDGHIPSGYFVQPTGGDDANHRQNLVAWDGQKVLGWIHRIDYLPDEPGLWPEYWVHAASDNLSAIFRRWMKRKHAARRIPWVFRGC